MENKNKVRLNFLLSILIIAAMTLSGMVFARGDGGGHRGGYHHGDVNRSNHTNRNNRNDKVNRNTNVNRNVSNNYNGNVRSYNVNGQHYNYYNNGKYYNNCQNVAGYWLRSVWVAATKRCW